MTGRVALVTGGTRGIGRAISEGLKKAGYRVVASYGGNDAVAQAFTADTGIPAYKFDVGDFAACQAAVAKISAEIGPIEVLVNNAGITRDGLMLRMKTADWRAVIDLNLTGVFLCSRAVSRAMLKARQGRIINITSVVALFGNAGQANYSAAKAGVIGLTRSNAAEFAARGVTVNAVAPGFIASDMTADLDQEAILRAIPLARMGTAAEVAGAVRFLAADPAAAYITGQVLQVDGGMVMR
jgi:3-oxoacyl-[acyl-carrier protein] reductase